jgi:hypothetical protein
LEKESLFSENNLWATAPDDSELTGKTFQISNELKRSKTSVFLESNYKSGTACIHRKFLGNKKETLEILKSLYYQLSF